MDRQQHLDWAKERALEYVEMGDLAGAWISFVSDLGKHPQTADHSAIGLGARLWQTGHLATAQRMRTFIEGFN